MIPSWIQPNNRSRALLEFLMNANVGVPGLAPPELPIIPWNPLAPGLEMGEEAMRPGMYPAMPSPNVSMPPPRRAGARPTVEPQFQRAIAQQQAREALMKRMTRRRRAHPAPPFNRMSREGPMRSVNPFRNEPQFTRLTGRLF